LYDVIVIGAGFAGLSAAVRLVERGARVVVVEARRQLGGRATSFRDPQTGEWVDNGQHLLLGCYRETLAFLGTIGARDRVAMQPSLEVSFVDCDGRASTLTCPMLPSPWHLLGGLLEWDALAATDRFAAFNLVSAVRLALAELRGGDRRAASPGETVEAWLIRNGQTRRLREMLWDPLAIAALNQSPARAAAPYFSRVLAEMLAAGAEGSAVVLPRTPLHEMYAEPARAWLEARGSQVMTGSAARVMIDGAKVQSVQTDKAAFAAPAVVAAVPWHALPSLFIGGTAPLAAVLDAASRTAASPIVTVNLWTEGRTLDAPFVGLPGRAVQWVFDKRVILGRRASHLSLVSSAADGLDGRPNDAIVRLAVEEVSNALPQMRENRVVRANVVRERRATFSLAPGQPQRPGVQTGVAGLFLAGDWIDTGLPGTIESAVRSGHAAADAVMQGSRLKTQGLRPAGAQGHEP
jgi:squalene-associated FAD-dependent desaturase